MKVKYRLECDYLARKDEHTACFTSEPIYTLKEGIKRYMQAIKGRCIDDEAKACKVHLWKYNWDSGELKPITIAKNY